MTELESQRLQTVVADLKAQRLRYAVLLDRTEHLKGTRYRESLEQDYREICNQLSAITAEFTRREPEASTGGASQG